MAEAIQLDYSGLNQTINQLSSEFRSFTSSLNSTLNSFIRNSNVESNNRLAVKSPPPSENSIAEEQAINKAEELREDEVDFLSYLPKMYESLQALLNKPFVAEVNEDSQEEGFLASILGKNFLRKMLLNPKVLGGAAAAIGAGVGINTLLSYFSVPENANSVKTMFEDPIGWIMGKTKEYFFGNDQQSATKETAPEMPSGGPLVDMYRDAFDMYKNIYEGMFSTVANTDAYKSMTKSLNELDDALQKPFDDDFIEKRNEFVESIDNTFESITYGMKGILGLQEEAAEKQKEILDNVVKETSGGSQPLPYDPLTAFERMLGLSQPNVEEQQPPPSKEKSAVPPVPKKISPRVDDLTPAPPDQRLLKQQAPRFDFDKPNAAPIPKYKLDPLKNVERGDNFAQNQSDRVSQQAIENAVKMISDMETYGGEPHGMKNDIEDGEGIIGFSTKMINLPKDLSVLDDPQKVPDNFTKMFNSKEEVAEFMKQFNKGKAEEIKLTDQQARTLKRIEIRKSREDLEGMEPNNWFRKLPEAIQSTLLALHYQVGADKFREFKQMKNALVNYVETNDKVLQERYLKEAGDNIVTNFRNVDGEYDYEGGDQTSTKIFQQTPGRAKAYELGIKNNERYTYRNGKDPETFPNVNIDPTKALNYIEKKAKGFIAKEPSVIMTGEYSGAGENPEVTIQMNALENRVLATTGHMMKLKQELENKNHEVFLSSLESRLQKTMENSRLSEERVRQKESVEKQMLQVQMPVMNSVVDNKTINNNTNPILVSLSSRNEYNRFRTS